ncbi:hypothetical protein BDK51DRAFT_41860 [Blyttiomyces helicus]|uniref:Uncharacterized protein n=1 Tax=Blyttiomyces helicus TaxID=388810 RepID=A0A4P9WEN1_9FUNG|nr:hypothetical protein BDK51DRAFT_41860 [Blyttiomyces helicus]|eukprot:RKO90245.1 hypothetical protein BDK51DRAFT_41860 [Blyttiomyces helicus]
MTQVEEAVQRSKKRSCQGRCGSPVPPGTENRDQPNSEFPPAPDALVSGLPADTQSINNHLSSFDAESGGSGVELGAKLKHIQRLLDSPVRPSVREAAGSSIPAHAAAYRIPSLSIPLTHSPPESTWLSRILSIVKTRPRALGPASLAAVPPFASAGVRDGGCAAANGPDGSQQHLASPGYIPTRVVLTVALVGLCVFFAYQLLDWAPPGSLPAYDPNRKDPDSRPPCELGEAKSTAPQWVGRDWEARHSSELRSGRRSLQSSATFGSRSLWKHRQARLFNCGQKALSRLHGSILMKPVFFLTPGRLPMLYSIPVDAGISRPGGTLGGPPPRESSFKTTTNQLLLSPRQMSPCPG